MPSVSKMARKSEKHPEQNQSNPHTPSHDEKAHDHEHHEGHDHSHAGHEPQPQEAELQSKYYEYQLIAEQLKQLQQQNATLDEQLAELQQALQGLTDLENTKEGKELLMPVSQGIFAKATLKDSKSLIVSVGNNVMVKKTTKDTIAMINDRIDAVSAYKKDTGENQVKLMARARELEAELQKLLQGIKG
jgi:prefoldin alpha subunit